MILITDIETDGLIDFKLKKWPTIIHCATTIDFTTGRLKSYSQHQNSGLLSISEFIDDLESADLIVGHNFIRYDRPVIHYLTKYEVPLAKIEDTLIYSRMLDPKKPEGHSLAAWGKFFGQEKPEHDDWSQFSTEMLFRNTEDTEINVKTYKYLKNRFNELGFSEESYKVERNIAHIFFEQEKYGFPLQEEYAREVYYEIKDKADDLEKELRNAFPSLPDTRKTQLREFKPRFNKDGTLNKVSERILNEQKAELDTADCTFFEWRPFDPNSGKDRVKHLLRLGWQPFEFTDKGFPQISEESLEAFNHPVASKLTEYIILRNREAVIYRWLSEVDSSGFVHSPVNQLGAWTHRCSHTNFFGNPPSVRTEKFENIDDFDSSDKPLAPEYSREKVVNLILNEGEAEVPLTGFSGRFGYECRKMWGVKRDSTLVQVGVDASGIQMRAFAHYIEDKEYVRQILSSDIHSYNQSLAGFKKRKHAKTFIYAFLLGSGDHKTGLIYDPSGEEISKYEEEVMAKHHKKTREILDYGLEYLKIPKTPRNYAIALKGRQIKTKFIEALPGLKKLKNEAKAGWVSCLDGRKLLIPSKHLYLAGHLQSFEQAVIKRANVDYYKELTKRNIWFKQVNQVHDEYQIITEKSSAETVGKTVVKAIVNTGKIYKTLCPLDGEYKIGHNWMETH